MGGIAGTALMLCEASGVGATLRWTPSRARPASPWARWLLAFPSYGFLLSVRPRSSARLCAAFAAREIAAAVVGRVDDGRELTFAPAATRGRALWDLADTPLTGFGGGVARREPRVSVTRARRLSTGRSRSIAPRRRRPRGMPEAPRRMRMGMPHLDAGGLSESWLLRDAGDRHWEAIGRAPGRRHRRDSRRAPASACTRRWSRCARATTRRWPPCARTRCFEVAAEVVPCGRACAHGRGRRGDRRSRARRFALELLTTFAARGAGGALRMAGRASRAGATLAGRRRAGDRGLARAARRGEMVDDPFCGPVLATVGPGAGRDRLRAVAVRRLQRRRAAVLRGLRHHRRLGGAALVRRLVARRRSGRATARSPARATGRCATSPVAARRLLLRQPALGAALRAALMSFERDAQRRDHARAGFVAARGGDAAARWQTSSRAGCSWRERGDDRVAAGRRCAQVARRAAGAAVDRALHLLDAAARQRRAHRAIWPTRCTTPDATSPCTRSTRTGAASFGRCAPRSAWSRRRPRPPRPRSWCASRAAELAAFLARRPADAHDVYHAQDCLTRQRSPGCARAAGSLHAGAHGPPRRGLRRSVPGALPGAIDPRSRPLLAVSEAAARDVRRGSASRARSSPTASTSGASRAGAARPGARRGAPAWRPGAPVVLAVGGVEERKNTLRIAGRVRAPARALTRGARCGSSAARPCSTTAPTARRSTRALARCRPAQRARRRAGRRRRRRRAGDLSARRRPGLAVAARGLRAGRARGARRRAAGRRVRSRAPFTEFLDASCATLVDPTSEEAIAAGLVEAWRLRPRGATPAGGAPGVTPGRASRPRTRYLSAPASTERILAHAGNAFLGSLA